MNQNINSDERERILLVGVDLGRKDEIDIESSMAELENLVLAADGEVVTSIVQSRERIDSTYYIGKGKAEEIAIYCDELDIGTVVFNDELSGAQTRNLEDLINKKIIDRTNLILDIFAKRATSKEGKLQVELAQLKYRLPRLVGYRNYLSRTGGGIGTRGPGEKKLETDRRHIMREIKEIERQLQDLENVRMIKRQKRQKSQLPIVALVGYTNAGKSTLLNTLIKSDKDYESDKEVFVYDMLFATLDTTLRKTTFPNGQNFLVTDTVGFVNKLPTHLVEAFKGTLEEVKYADLLLHVVDASSENIDMQIRTTVDILKEMQVLDKRIITVYNKIDKIKLEDELISDVDTPKIFISAKKELNIEQLLYMIQENIPQRYYKVHLLIPYDKSELVSYLFDNTKVEESKYIVEGILINTTVNEIEYNRLKEYIK